jgi:hypothetical protein
VWLQVWMLLVKISRLLSLILMGLRIVSVSGGLQRCLFCLRDTQKYWSI